MTNLHAMCYPRKKLKSDTLFKEKGRRALIGEKAEELNSSPLLTPNHALVRS